MKLDIIRFAYTPENTQGKLYADDWSCFTMEQPWRRWDYKGGEPFHSCIPEGNYDLVPFTRSNKHADKAFAIVNPALGVYFAEDDMPRGRGRFACLIHGRANYVGDVKGCAAAGEQRLIDPKRNELMVTSSVTTMRSLIDAVGWVNGHTLTISQIAGAVDGYCVARDSAHDIHNA